MKIDSNNSLVGFSPVWAKKLTLSFAFIATCGLAVFSPGLLLADIVYVSSSPQGGCTVTANCPGPNTDGTYAEIGGLNVGDFGARGTAVGRPSLRPVPRTYISGTSLTDTNQGVDIMPALGVPGAVYQIDYNFSSTAGNTSTDIVMSATAANGSLSFTETDKLQRQFGSPNNQWQLMGYITNGTGTPTISFRYKSGAVNGGTQNRLIIDTWRFTQVVPCLAVPVVDVTGPLSTNSNQVIVAGVNSAANTITVYQKTTSSFVPIGTKTTGVTAGANSVTVTGLVKGAQVAATQTIGTQEGCVPTAGTLVGGGANPTVRIAYTIRETIDTGPVGAPAINFSNANLHFLGANVVSVGAPIDANVVFPSNQWQTFSLVRGAASIADASNVVGTVIAIPGYSASSSVAIRVYAYRTVNGIRLYSTNGVQSSTVTSNDTFSVNWAWSAVTGAEGYRLLRNVLGDFLENVDVLTNSYTDNSSGWGSNIEVTPNSAQIDRSVQWNPTIGNTNNLPGQWGILESINFAIVSDDTGPFDLYIDNIQNGSTVFQTFENALAGRTDFGFRSPTFSGTTSGNLLSAPNVGVVTNSAADTGTKSFHVQFQWSGTNIARWLRLTTSGVGSSNGTGNPLVNLDDPISIRLLLLPVGAPAPIAPPAPSLSISKVGSDVLLNWPGAHRLLEATNVTGPYLTNGVTFGPYTNAAPIDPQKFYRLKD